MPTLPAPASSRSEFFELAGAYSPFVCAQVGEAQLLVRTHDQHIGRAVFVKGGRGDIKALRRCVAAVAGLLGGETIAGRTLIDVGANIGTTTIPALLTLPFARAVALEPEAENFATLRLNLLLNNLEERTVAIQAAASNRLGELDLVVDTTRSGKHWIATDETRLPRANEGSVAMKVPVVTLDSLAGEAYDPDAVGLLWMDAENHEGHILEGASELLRRGVPVVFEWDPEGLDKRGDKGKIHRIVNENYTHFADMRASSDPQRPKFELRAARELLDYCHVTAEGENHFTEILALRLEGNAGQLPDLMGALRRGNVLEREWPRALERIARAAPRSPAKQDAFGWTEEERLRHRLAETVEGSASAAARLESLQGRIAELEARLRAVGDLDDSKRRAVEAKLGKLRQQAADVQVRLDRLAERREDTERRLARLGKLRAG
jgi:FkbM family methyltransferase